jgi:hypothetical protein
VLNSSENYQTIFEKIKNLAGDKKRTPAWYRRNLSMIMGQYKQDPDRIITDEQKDNRNKEQDRDKNIRTKRIFVGHMYLFRYTAKSKYLPYHDNFPLVYVMKVNGGEFYGFNLHYLRPTANRRMYVVDKLKEDRIDVPKKIIHKYLYERCDSFFLDIAKSDWMISAALPVEDFVLTQSKGKVSYDNDYVWSEVDQHWNDRLRAKRIIASPSSKDKERVK